MECCCSFFFEGLVEYLTLVFLFSLIRNFYFFERLGVCLNWSWLNFNRLYTSRNSSISCKFQFDEIHMMYVLRILWIFSVLAVMSPFISYFCWYGYSHCMLFNLAKDCQLCWFSKKLTHFVDSLNSVYMFVCFYSIDFILEVHYFFPSTLLSAVPSCHSLELIEQHLC